MATYQSKPVTVGHSAESLFDRISDMNAFQERLDMLPPEAKAKMGDVRFTSDSIIINAPAMGEIKFNVVERRRPELIRMEAEKSPVPFGIELTLTPESEVSTTVLATLNVEIPAMLKPMINSTMQDAANKFGEMFGNFFG